MPEPSSTNLAAGLAKIGLVLRHHAWKAGAQAGVTPTQSQVLALLHARGRDTPLAISDIAAQLALTAPTVSDSVAALERKGLATRTRAPLDARVVHVRLTPAGLDTVRHSALWPDALLAAIDSLAPDEQAVFVRALTKMIYALQHSGQIPTARMCPTCTYFTPNAHPDPAAPHHCGYVDAPLADTALRLDCPEHAPAPASDAPRLWDLFINGQRPAHRPGPAVPPSVTPGRPTPHEEFHP